MSTHVSAEVRSWMGRRGLRQADLAESIGLSRQAIGARLKGRTQWTVDDLAAVAKALGVSMDVLLRGPDEQ